MKQISFSQVECRQEADDAAGSVPCRNGAGDAVGRGAGSDCAALPEGERGRPPVGLERMLRAYLVQQWYNPSDEGAEDEITDNQALRGFVGIDLSRESAPDATTLLQFRHLLDPDRGGVYGEDNTVYLDAGYTGVEKREDLKEREIDWQVAMKRGKLKAVPEDRVLGQLLRKLESVKASIQSKVEMRLL